MARVRLLVAICALFAISVAVEGRKGFGPGEQEYGYVNVREGAHTFYWLYYTKAPGAYADKPLVMWLQGGPGAASTSFGNFMEIGPQKADLTIRNSSWVKYVNTLFVDNPVGTGFSYVDKLPYLATNNTQIGKDLVEFMRGFLNTYPTFKKTPFYIFSESYGGKMAAEFALQLEKERKNGLEVNLKGVALGDAWISPIDSVLTWAPFLYQTGLVDKRGFETIDMWAKKTQEALDQGRFKEATDLWGQTERVVMSVAGNVDFYNILSRVLGSRFRNGEPTDPQTRPLALPGSSGAANRASDAALERLMNGPVRKAFGDTIPDGVVHEVSSSTVFSYLYNDFMLPVTDVVEELLNTTDIEVIVYNGHLDLIVDTPGTVHWVDRLKWSMGDYWRTSAPRSVLSVNGIAEGFVKKAKTLSFYWINRAGHMVPSDNPDGTYGMLRLITKFDKK